MAFARGLNYRKGIAQDDKWITVKPNGENAKGRPVLLGDKGEIKAGMGGKFNGQKLSDARKGFTGPRITQKQRTSKKNDVSAIGEQESNSVKLPDGQIVKKSTLDLAIQNEKLYHKSQWGEDISEAKAKEGAQKYLSAALSQFNENEVEKLLKDRIAMSKRSLESAASAKPSDLSDAELKQQMQALEPKYVSKKTTEAEGLRYRQLSSEFMKRERAKRESKEQNQMSGRKVKVGGKDIDSSTMEMATKYSKIWELNHSGKKLNDSEAKKQATQYLNDMLQNFDEKQVRSLMSEAIEEGSRILGSRRSVELADFLS